MRALRVRQLGAHSPSSAHQWEHSGFVNWAPTHHRLLGLELLEQRISPRARRAERLGRAGRRLVRRALHVGEPLGCLGGRCLVCLPLGAHLQLETQLDAIRRN